MRTIERRFQSDESRAQGEDSLGGSLSHPQYRALVVREATKAGRRPSTKDFYLAQKKVDVALGKVGATISIPGAGPGRRTV